MARLEEHQRCLGQCCRSPGDREYRLRSCCWLEDWPLEERRVQNEGPRGAGLDSWGSVGDTPLCEPSYSYCIAPVTSEGLRVFV